MRGAALPLAAAAALAAGAASGCASVLSIPNDTPSFCAQAANQGHDYCEDFDVGDWTQRWTFAETNGGSTIQPGPSDRSAPNLIDLSSPAVAQGSTALAGFTKEFDDATFDGLHIEADVRFVTQGGDKIKANGGFLLVTDKSGGCIGLGIGGASDTAPAGIGALVFSSAASCSLLTSGGGGGPLSNNPLLPAPAPNGWFHIVVDVARDPGPNDSTGVLKVNVVGQPISVPPVTLPAGTLVPSGIPLVGFAAQVNGPSSAFEVQYDNITIDVQRR